MATFSIFTTNAPTGHYRQSDHSAWELARVESRLSDRHLADAYYERTSAHHGARTSLGKPAFTCIAPADRTKRTRVGLYG